MQVSTSELQALQYQTVSETPHRGTVPCDMHWLMLMALGAHASARSVPEEAGFSLPQACWTSCSNIP